MAFSCVFPTGYTLSGAEAAKYIVSKRFTLLSLWEAQNLTLTEAEECEIIPGDGTFNWTTASDTTGFDIDGWSGLSATNFISIESLDPPAGVFDDSKYSLEVTNDFCIDTTLTFLNFKGLQFQYLGNTNTRGCLRLRGSDCLVDSCIAKRDSASTATNTYGFYWFLAPDGKIKNCFAYDFLSNGNAGMRLRTTAAASIFAYNNTVSGNTVGFNTNSGNAVLKNNIAFSNTTDYDNILGTGSTNNAFSNGTGPGTDPIDISSEVGTDLFVDFTNDDYHLKSGTVLEDAGVDLVADSDLPVPVDFEGNARGDPPEVGPFEIIAAGSVGASVGTSVVTGIGISTHEGVGSSSGIATVTGVGASVNTGVGSAAGIATVTGIGKSTNAGVGSSTGVSTATGIGISTHSGVGNSSGTSVVLGIGISTHSGVGSSAGLSVVSGIGISTNAGVGTSVGIATVNGIGISLFSGVGSSTGTSTVSGVGISTNAGVGTSAGLATVLGISVSGGIINGALEILVETDFGSIEIDVEGLTIEVDTG